MKRGTLCLLLLLSGCTPDDDSIVRTYALRWTCLSPDGCERTAEVERIDRMKRVDEAWQFTSTRDQTFAADATLVVSAVLPEGCAWVYFLSLFEHTLERSKVCFLPGGFDLELSIPNEDPATSSMWLVEGRDVNVF